MCTGFPQLPILAGSSVEVVKRLKSPNAKEYSLVCEKLRQATNLTFRSVCVIFTLVTVVGMPAVAIAVPEYLSRAMWIIVMHKPRQSAGSVPYLPDPSRSRVPRPVNVASEAFTSYI